MTLPFEDVCMPALELKAREKEAIPLGLFWLLTKLCSPLCFCQVDTNGLMPLVFNDFPGWARLRRAGPVLSGLRSGRGLCCPLATKKNPGAKVRRRAAKHGDAGGAGDGAASRGLIYRHSARHKPVMTA